jgi:iron complex outermembrane recepter protein
MKPLCHVLAIGVSLFFLMESNLVPLRAQEGAGTITGTVLDQAGKSIPAASVTVKGEATTFSRSTASDNEGHFSVSGLSAGSYTIETSSPGFALNSRRGVPVSGGTENVSITLNVDAISQSVTVQETVLLAAETAPAGNTLDATAARTEISTAVITNFMPPVADFAEVIMQAPGAFSLNPNGIGLGQGKSFFRGFPDGDYTMQFDGIPFEDTNSPTHHSWASFPAQWISSTDFNRSPGNASDFGPTNFGGIINLKSPELQADPDIRGTFSYGSFNTKLYSLDMESGLFGPGKRDSVLANINAMTSDGYQTFNYQQRDAGYAKFQHRFSDRTTLSLYGGVVDIWNNTPNTTNPTRAQVAQFGNNYLLDNTPTCVAVTLNCSAANGSPDPYYYGYNTYHVQTDFEYASYSTDFGNGWKFDNKAYTTRYWNKQFYQNGASVSLSTATPSGVDKLNGYRHAGDTAILSWESKWGVFRTGTWYDWAYTDRYQYPSNILTQENTPLPNFHEHFTTESFQPFAEFEWRATQRLVVTAGIKAADYRLSLQQYQDNYQPPAAPGAPAPPKTKGIVGCLGGTNTVYPASAGIWAGAPECIGGAAFTHHTGNFNSWLPTLTARYRVWKQWSLYAEFAEGSQIPVSAVYDTPGGNVLVPPKPVTAKTYQTGSVLKLNRFTLDMDAYYIHFQNGYASYTDVTTGEPVYYATPPSNTKGIEAEGNIALGYGLSLYGNLSFGNAKYKSIPSYIDGGRWVANTPTDVEGLSLLYQHRNWDIGFTYKRVGQYYNDNGSINQAIVINPFDLENVFVNYTIKNASRFRGTKIQLAMNNLADSHNIVGISPANAGTISAPFTPAAGDQLNLLPGRSVTITITGGWAPRR